MPFGSNYRDQVPATVARLNSPTPIVVATASVSDRVRDLTIWSPAVGGDGAVRLILPNESGRDPSIRYPVLYLLHGSGDSECG